MPTNTGNIGQHKRSPIGLSGTTINTNWKYSVGNTQTASTNNKWRYAVNLNNSRNGEKK